ncbi:DUF4352 domain-containing protein [Streptomyces sp. NPDC060243]|uniref:DUF4352 domain-containing protein n=1 Tax=Streptomyces sp. NPDC060243 TaxID=3347081 RepID=UPI00365A595E
MSKSSDKPVTPAASSSPSPSPTPAARTSFKLGETAVVDEPANKIRFKVTAIAYVQPERGPQPPTPELGGDTWATLEVKTCAVKGTIEVTQQPWALAYESGTRVWPTGLSGGDMPRPEYAPSPVQLRPGDCMRGKIPYAVRGKDRPVKAVYSPEGTDSPLDWAVPGK